MNNTDIFALDFDGVICDSAVETGLTGWKAASKIWNDMPEVAPTSMLDDFKRVRPIIETGYESILAMRLLFLGESIDAIYADYNNKMEYLLQDAKVGIDDLKTLFGETRDTWIAKDLSGWLTKNPLFPGVAEKLRKLGDNNTWYVITTKQERFVKQILAANEIELPEKRIYGLDRNMSKVNVLKQLIQEHPDEKIYFVEDRLPTLLKVAKTDDLTHVLLIFALWGYNTPEDKQIAAQQPFVLQTLENFLV